jgi:hypothetical protein
LVTIRTAQQSVRDAEAACASAARRDHPFCAAKRPRRRSLRARHLVTIRFARRSSATPKAECASAALGDHQKTLSSCQRRADRYHRDMTMGYDEAVQALYRAPHEAFVTERKRLAAELKASGDAAGAQRLGKLARPTISAWAVNQLFWHERATFQQMFESAAELRAGKLAARDAHRRAMATLSARARKLLAEGGHAVSEGTVRRVEATLAGLAAAGGFAPEPEGALTKDRDPPGFEAFGISSAELKQTQLSRRCAHTRRTRKPSRATPQSRAKPSKRKPRRPSGANMKRHNERAQRPKPRANAKPKRGPSAKPSSASWRALCAKPSVRSPSG